MTKLRIISRWRHYTRYIHRSAVTGRFVTEAFARKHPKTTVKETWRL